MYTSQQAIITNAMQANVALIKLADYAAVYAQSVPSPTNPGATNDPAEIESMRHQYMEQACRVNEQAVVGTIQRKRGHGGAHGSNKNLRAIMLDEAGVPLYSHVSSSGFGRYP